MSRSNDQSTPQAALVTPQYAPASLALPWYRQRSFRRGIAGVILIMIALVIGYAYRDLPQHWKFARLQNRCFAYTAPNEQIVYSEIPTDIAKLPASSPEYALDLSVTPSSVFHRPQCWVEFDTACSGFPAPAYPVLFLGQRSNGSQRGLVSILFKGWPQKSRSWIPPDPNVYLISGPSFELECFGIDRHNGRWHFTGSLVTAPPGEPVRNLRFFAGQRDPTDPSRFTIVYQANDKSGAIEGRLEADDTVSLQIKDGPLQSRRLLP